MADVGKCTLSYTCMTTVIFTQTTENVGLTIQEQTTTGTQYIDEDEET